MEDITTQDGNVLQLLKSGQTITPIQALNKFGCFRLAAVVHRLRKEQGWPIHTDIIKHNKKHWAQYSLDQNKDTWPE